MSELQPRIQAEMDLMWEQRALDQSIDDGPSREEAIDSAVDYLYGLGSLDEKTPRGAAARKLREDLSFVHDIDPETSAATTVEGLIDKTREYNRLKARWESVQKLRSDEYEFQRDMTRPMPDKQYVKVAQLKEWFGHLSQLRDLKFEEQLFLEYGVTGLDVRGLRLHREWSKKYEFTNAARAHVAHWLIHDAETHELEQEIGEAYHEFVGSDDMVRELDDYFTRGEIRRNVEYANESGKTGSRYTAASILWTFVHEQERITRPDIVIGALSRITGNSHEEDWSAFGESIKTGVLEDILEVDRAKAIVELVADYGRSGHYPNSITSQELGHAVGTLAKMGNLELSETPQNLELSASIQ